MKQVIFPNDFLPYYPIGIAPCTMYVRVANRIYEAIKDLEISLPFSDDIKIELAINIAIYYEDKVSNIGIWNAFVWRHSKMYLTSLPFFDDFTMLYPDDINQKEIELLIWIVMSRNFDDRFLNPLVIVNDDVMDEIMEILTEDDVIEENEDLYNFIYNKEITQDYFKLKRVMMWLRNAYLFYSPLSDDTYDEKERNYSNLCNQSETKYYAETEFLMNVEIGPLALPVHQCLSDMYRVNDWKDVAKKLDAIEYCQQDFFHIDKKDSNRIWITDTKGNQYCVVNDFSQKLKNTSYIITSLVKFDNNDWEINGGMFSSPKELFDKKKEKEDTRSISLEHSSAFFMKRTQGKRLFFFEDFVQLKEWLKEVAPELDNSTLKENLSEAPMVAFISSKAGIIFAPDIIHAIKSEDNPYYRQADAGTLQVETIRAIIDWEVVHPELLAYLLENNMLVDGNLSHKYLIETGNIIFTRNIDFIARNHRRHFYHDHGY